jgi:hypothetical protein
MSSDGYANPLLGGGSPVIGDTGFTATGQLESGLPYNNNGGGTSTPFYRFFKSTTNLAVIAGVLVLLVLTGLVYHQVRQLDGAIDAISTPQAVDNTTASMLEQAMQELNNKLDELSVDIAAAAPSSTPSSSVAPLLGASDVLYVQLMGEALLESADTRPNKPGPMDRTTFKAQSQINYLRKIRDEFVLSAKKATNNAIAVEYEDDTFVHMVRVRLNGAQASTVTSHPSVVDWQFERSHGRPDTDPRQSMPAEEEDDTFTPYRRTINECGLVTVNNKVLDAIGAYDAWCEYFGPDDDSIRASAGAGVIVGYLDSGIPVSAAYTHPCFVDTGYPEYPQKGDTRFTNNKVVIARFEVDCKCSKGAELFTDFDMTNPYPMRRHGTMTSSMGSCNYAVPVNASLWSLKNSGITHMSGAAPASLVAAYTGQGLSAQSITALLRASFDDGVSVMSRSDGIVMQWPTPLIPGHQQGDPVPDGTNSWVFDGIPGVNNQGRVVGRTMASLTRNDVVMVQSAANNGPAAFTVTPDYNADTLLVGASDESTFGAIFKPDIFTILSPTLVNYVAHWTPNFKNPPVYPFTSPALRLTMLVSDGTLTGDTRSQTFNTASGVVRLSMGCPLNDGTPTWTKIGNLAGSIIVMSRGACPFAQKALTGNFYGATALLIVDSIVQAAPPQLGASGVIVDMYVGSVRQVDGPAVVEKVLASVANNASNARFTILGELNAVNITYRSRLMAYTSMGPTQNYDISPDLLAPAQSVAAQAPFLKDNPSANEWMISGGTSASGPLVSGTAALVRQLHPDWNAADVRSVITNYARQTSIYNSAQTATQLNPNKVGCGVLHLGNTLAARVSFVPRKLSFGALDDITGSMQKTVTLTLKNLYNDSAMNVILQVDNTRVNFLDKGPAAYIGASMAHYRVQEPFATGNNVPRWTLSSTEIVLAAGESVEVDVTMTANPKKAARAHYFSFVRALNADTEEEFARVPLFAAIVGPTNDVL